MSIIKRPYEISVWEDIYSGTETDISTIDYTSDAIIAPTNNLYKIGTYLQEKKIAVIGGNNFQHQGRVCEPNYNIDIKNKTTLTFSIYRKYYDNKTGELVDNPFYKYITNERKIKLKYEDGLIEDKWHDFIITNISENSTNYKTDVVATDAAVVELSKIGFNKTFNSELQNNTNTVNNLAKTALNGTVWQLDEEKTETIKQYQLDNLVKIELPFVLNSSNVPVPLEITLYSNDNYTWNVNQKATLAQNSIVYLFYSQLMGGKENNKTISLLFLPDNISNTNWTTKEATNKDFIDNVLQNACFGTIDVSDYEWTTLIQGSLRVPSIFHKTGSAIYYIKKGKRLIQNQISHYDKLLNRYVKNYTKIANTDRLVTLHTIPSSREGSPHTKAYLLPTTTQSNDKQIIFNHYQIVYGFLSELQNKGDKNQCLHFLFLTNNINSETISTSSISNSSDINNGYLCTINLKGQNSAWQEKEITYNSNTYIVYVPYTYCYNENPTITNYTAPCESDLVYGYEEDEYNVQPLVQNLLANMETATTLDGWALCEEEKLRVTRLGLGMARKESSEPDYPFMQIGVYLNANNMFRGNTDYILNYDIDHGNNKTHHLQTSYTRFANFITNSCITDNAAVIGTLQPGDKFRLKLNVERNITDFSSISTTSITGVHDNLNVLRGLQPYIVKLPQNKTVTDLLTDITLLNSSISRTTDDWKKYFKITGNIAPITFGYLPYDNFRNFDCDRAYYIKYKSNGTADKIVSDLRLFGNTSLVPIYKNPTSGTTNWSAPLFFIPYWRLFELLGYTGHTAYIEALPESQARDGDNDTYDSTAKYLLNANGEQAFLNYWNNESSKFTFLDFCIICDITNCIQRNSSNNLSWIGNPGSSYQSYYITFSDPTTFLSTTRSTKTFENFTTLMSNCEYYQCIDFNNGYFNKLNKKNGTIILKNDDNSATSIQADDIVAILSLRDTWNLIEYMPYVSGQDSYCTFETIGTYNGIPQSISGDETLIYANSDSPLRLTTTYNNTSLTKEDILGYNNYGQLCFLFGYYGSWASNESVSSGGYMNLSLSHLQLTRYYEDENGNVIEPDAIPAASTRKIYYYFSPDYGYGGIDNIEKPEQILYLSKSYTPLNSVTPVINNTGEAYQSITVTESNIFNILQKLSEVFECWLNTKIVHDDNGAISIIDGKPQKFIYFTKYINDIRNYGYSYGLNLNSTQRNIITDDIVTKMIVKANSNEFGIDKYTTISRSKYNVLGGTEIFNFDYFINKQLLPANIYEVLYDTYGKPLKLISEQINTNNKKLQQLAVEISQIDSERQFYQEQNKAAINEITIYNKNFQSLTGRSYGYYLANKTSLTDIWNKDGLISLFLEYIEKIQYFTGVRKTSDLLYKERNEVYKNKYAEYNNIIDRNTILTSHRSKIMEEFYNIYHAYIREGSWISEDYLDDDKYFFAAQDVLNTSAQPKVTYTFNVVDIGALEEFKGYNFKLGDKTFIEDPEFFGYEEDGITPYKEEVTISGMQINLDSPEKNTITIQNYRTQFQDLFQRIAATVQAVEYHTGNYRNTKTERP